MEAVSIARAAEEAGLDAFDLVGYSGGAAMSLAFVAAYPERVRSVTLAETPWIGNDLWSDLERSFVAVFDQAVTLPPVELVPAVFDLLSHGVELPADPSKLERTALMLRTVWDGYRRTPLDRSLLGKFSGPAYLPVGSRSNPRFLAAAEMLASVFPKSRVEVLDGRNHFDLFWKEPTRLAESVRTTWETTETHS